MNVKMARLQAANAACLCFIPETQLEIRNGRIYVVWDNHHGKHYARPWATRGQSFYPSWYRHWGHGGTCITALSQLIRFVLGKPVLPISTWEYWCSDTVRLAAGRGIDKRAELLAIIRDGGYPVNAACIFCDKSPIGRFDWYSRGKISGPGCNPLCEQGRL